MKLLHWVPHKIWRRDGRTASIPCGHWKDAGTFPPPNAKELGMCVTGNWYPPAFSISLDSEEGEGRVQWRVWSAIWGVVRVECCEVWDHMWDVAKLTVIVIIAATVLITVTPLPLPWLWCDCAWRTHDSGKWSVCNAVLAIAKVINKSSKATVSLHFTNDSKQCPYTSHHMWVLSMSSSVLAVTSPKEARRVFLSKGGQEGVV